ncbi:MAG: class I SAM-dependent methyltransferase [Hyphomicrobiaceae bacterium]
MPKEQPGGRRICVIETPGFSGYALLDSGEGRKLERFGQMVLDRPEAQALWSCGLPKAAWDKAHAVFSGSGDEDEKGRWRIDKPVGQSWPLDVAGVTMQCRLQGLWHVGLFPEQMPHWQWMLKRIADMREARPDQRPRVLNLFGYTGAASLLAAKAGAEVTHLDASKKAVAWARENQAASGLEDAPIRWIVDDAAKFVAREVRRKRTYNIILVDPPKFGRGPAGETWDLFTGVKPLLEDCARLLDAERAALVLTVYAIRASTLAFGQLMEQLLAGRSGAFDIGELVIREQAGRYALPTSLYTRWVSS